MLNKACPDLREALLGTERAVSVMYGGTGFTVNALVPKGGYHF
jgi:hypothetical protein